MLGNVSSTTVLNPSARAAAIARSASLRPSCRPRNAGRTSLGRGPAGGAQARAARDRVGRMREVQTTAWRRVLPEQRRELGGEALETERDAERLLVFAKQLARDVDIVRSGGLANRGVVYRDCSTR